MRNDNVIVWCDRIVEWCLYGLVFTIPFSKAAVSICVVGAIVFWSLKRVCGYRTDGFKGLVPATPLNTALAVYIVINVLSTVFSVDFSLSAKALFTKQIKFILMYLAVVETVNSRQRFKNIMYAVLASAVCVCLDAGIQYFRGEDFIKGYPGGLRLSACFSSSNGFAGWLIMIIPVFVGMIARRQTRFGGLKTQVFLSGLTGICLMYLWMTYSRGAWVGTCIACVVSLVYVFKRGETRSKKFCIYSIGLICVVLTLPWTRMKIHSFEAVRLNSGETIREKVLSTESLQIRKNLWRESLRIIRDYPLTGAGLNTYSIVAPHYKVSQDGGTYAHNSYLQMAAEIGLAGVISFFWIFVVFFRWGWGCVKAQGDSLLLGFLLAVLAALSHSFFDNNLYAFQLVIMFWFMVGLTVGLVKSRA